MARARPPHPQRCLPLALVLALAAPAAVADDIDRRALGRLASPPLGLPPVPLASGERPTAARIALGRKLFLDRRLSRNGTMSCAMCHIPEQGFANNELAAPIGVLGLSNRRNAPALFNVAYQKSLFHDGRETSLETQVIAPLIATREMANPSIGRVVARVARLDDYAPLFRRAFGAGPSIGRIGRALADWQTSLLSANSPFDRWRYGGDEAAVTEAGIRGFALFTGKAGCSACHKVGARSALFTDHLFHATGIGARRAERAEQPSASVRIEIAPGVFTTLARAVVDSVGEAPHHDAGRYEVTQAPADHLRFKTASLRNVALTAPYMHDGSLRTLADVVAFYDEGGVAHAGLDPLIRPLGLMPGERADLVAFLEALTGDNVAELIQDARSTGVGN